MDTNITIAIKTPEGISVQVPVDLSTMSEAERSAFLKFSASQKLSNLNQDEQNLLKNKKVYLRGEGIQAGLICRFDWHCWAV